MTHRRHKLRVIPGRSAVGVEGKGIHQQRVGAARESFSAADAAQMGSLPEPLRGSPGMTAKSLAGA